MMSYCMHAHTLRCHDNGIPTTVTRALMWSGLATISSGSEGQLVL